MKKTFLHKIRQLGADDKPTQTGCAAATARRFE